MYILSIGLSCCALAMARFKGEILEQGAILDQKGYNDDPVAGLHVYMSYSSRPSSCTYIYYKYKWYECLNMSIKKKFNHDVFSTSGNCTTSDIVGEK